MKYQELTYQIRGASFEVYRHLGAGLLESVYQKALIHELQLRQLLVSPEVAFTAYYKGQNVGNFRADLIVENTVLIELKAQNRLPETSEAQIINYLKLTKLPIGLLINFTTPKAIIKRFVT